MPLKDHIVISDNCSQSQDYIEKLVDNMQKPFFTKNIFHHIII